MLAAYIQYKYVYYEIYNGIGYFLPTIGVYMSVEGCFCGPFGCRVGECTFCNIHICIGYKHFGNISVKVLLYQGVSVRPSGAGLENVHFVIKIYICFGYECLNFEGR